MSETTTATAKPDHAKRILVVGLLFLIACGVVAIFTPDPNANAQCSTSMDAGYEVTICTPNDGSPSYVDRGPFK